MSDRQIMIGGQALVFSAGITNQVGGEVQYYVVVTQDLAGLGDCTVGSVFQLVDTLVLSDRGRTFLGGDNPGDTRRQAISHALRVCGYGPLIKQKD